MDYWDERLPFVITPKSGPLPQMTSLLDGNRALIGNLPQGYLKRRHWLTAGQALVTAAETGELHDVQLAFEAMVEALNEEGWLRQGIFEPRPSPKPPDVGSGGSKDIGRSSETIVDAETVPPETTVDVLDEEGFSGSIPLTEPPLSANPSDLGGSGPDVLTQRTEEPLWRRIHPN